jgi:F-type H+-transporting ATPase subunit b
MSIDWFTFAAQLLNFVLLLWLLKRFLYRPILNAIAARETKIAAELAHAAAVKAEAQEERNRFEQGNRELEQQRGALLDQATAEAKTEYERLVDEARTLTETQTRKRLEALESSVANLNEALRHRVQQEVFAIARKILTELASQSLEEHMADKLLTRLGALDTDAKHDLRNAIETDRHALVLRSAFALPKSKFNAISKLLSEIADGDIELRCEIIPDLIIGMELIANGHKLAWNTADYLASLEQSVAAMTAVEDIPGHPARAGSRHNQSAS